ncbi:MAG: ABC transporter substrate-binding protein [Gammaproteobacteria bacterium]|nr:ABC transporter substrate-binding protein [Gammaproteobacteria bacterium]
MLHKLSTKLREASVIWYIFVGITIWAFFISYMHFKLNTEYSERPVVAMGYMPVVTNLAAPIMDYVSKKDGEIRYRALKYASFAEMAESLRHGQIDAAFMIAPLSIVLRQQGEDVKVVYIGNRHESTLVARKELSIEKLEDLEGMTLAVPMRYSGHNLSILKLIEEKGLRGRINVVEMNPPDMASALSTGSLDAYYVGEPFAAQTLKSGHAQLVNYVEDVWPGFICNLVVVRQKFIDDKPEVVQHMVQSAIRSGLWAQENQQQAIEIAAQYWNQAEGLVEYAMTTPENRIVYNQYLPVEDELQYMADLLVKFNMLENADVSGLVEDRFAKSANTENITTSQSIITLQAD